MKDHIENSHVTKFNVFKVNRDQVVDLETWLKIHTNVVETASSKAIY